jgi:outer membrane receptor protein involved in Fe transport
MKRCILYLVLQFIGIQLTGQVISGKVSNSDGEPLIAASLQCGEFFTVTNEQGSYSLNKDVLDSKWVTITYIGFADKRISIDQLVKAPNIILEEEGSVLETMTITTSRYQKRLSETAVSVEVLKPNLIAAVNTVDIDDALDKVSGVQMINGQANIRGGSGFSYGAGSRVMLLIDDIPALQVDAGFTNWGDIPVENIGQVEIVKGAASSLYGSAALNGIINIRTGEAGLEPVTKISAAYQQFMDPSDLEKKWWGDTIRYESNLSVLHKRKIGKLDFVGSLFHTKLESYNQFTFKNRTRASVKLKHHTTDRLTFSLNGIFNHGDNGDFFLWLNGEQGALKPFPGSQAKQDNFRMYIDPSVHYTDAKNNRHKLLARYHYIDNQNSGNQSNASKTLYGEYQFARSFESLDLDLTAGVVGSNTTTSAELFGDTTFTTRTFATYVQGDKQFGPHFSLSGGLRYEYNLQLTPENFNDINVPNGEISDGRSVARLGARYSFNEYSAIRASWGQGYRFPTVTERFVSTVFGGFQISPNPVLNAESGWTAELGYKQGVKLGPFKGYVDAAFFTSEYREMMEFLFVLSNFSFTSTNVGDTKINGMEYSIFGSVDIGEAALQLFGGYTFIDPYYKNFEDSEQLRSNLSTDQNVLKYRVQHSFKMDAQLDYGRYSLGYAINYASHMVNIDRVLERIELTIPPIDLLGLGEYRAENNRGFTRIDLRASVRIRKLKLSVLINNALNEEYMIRPALMEAPRSIAARVDFEF